MYRSMSIHIGGVYAMEFQSAETRVRSLAEVYGQRHE